MSGSDFEYSLLEIYSNNIACSLFGLYVTKYNNYSNNNVTSFTKMHPDIDEIIVEYIGWYNPKFEHETTLSV